MGAKFAGAVGHQRRPPDRAGPRCGEPSSDPLTTPGAFYRHYRHRHGDGTGLRLGEQHDGTTLVALHGTSIGWSTWLARLPQEQVDRMPRWVTVHWTPPASVFRSTGVQLGARAIARAGEALRPDRRPGGGPGWVLWAVAPSPDGRPVRFKARRLLGDLEVAATGVVPFALTRPDGYTAVHSGAPLADPLPDWFIAELGGRVGRRPATV